MKSSVVKRSISVAGHVTSISLEDEFWKSLREIAHERDETLSHLVGDIDGGRHGNLSSAIRLFVLRHYRDQVDQQGGTVVDAVHSTDASAITR
jgi:predicted DNA-binding ribbon-helix-helix protein